jgi:hypothetical protein
MALIKFNNSNNLLDVSLSIDAAKRTIIIFKNIEDVPDKAILLSGFKEHNEHRLNFIQSDFSNMNYLYRQVDDTTYILTSKLDNEYVEEVSVDTSDDTDLSEQETEN